jgi:hypothetical protein
VNVNARLATKVDFGVFVLVAARSPFDLPSGQFSVCSNIMNDFAFWFGLNWWRFDFLAISAIVGCEATRCHSITTDIKHLLCGDIPEIISQSKGWSEPMDNAPVSFTGLDTQRFG